MDLEILSYFCTVADEQNITRAAQKLHMTQQNLSMHIARLERHYDIAFFARKPKLRLTHAGECLYSFAKSIHRQEDTLLKNLDAIRNRQSGSLSLGITQTRSQTLLPLVLPEFSRTHPLVKVDVNIRHVLELKDLLRKGVFDLVILPFSCMDPPIPEEPIENVTLFQDPICLTVPVRFARQFFSHEEDLSDFHALSTEQKWSVILNTPLLQSIPYVLTGSVLSKLGRKALAPYVPFPEVVLDLHDAEVLFSFSFAEMGAMFVFQSLLPMLKKNCREDFLIIPLKDPAGSASVIASYNKAKGLSWVARQFLDSMLASFAQQASGK